MSYATAGKRTRVAVWFDVTAVVGFALGLVLLLVSLVTGPLLAALGWATWTVILLIVIVQEIITERPRRWGRLLFNLAGLAFAIYLLAQTLELL